MTLYRGGSYSKFESAQTVFKRSGYGAAPEARVIRQGLRLVLAHNEGPVLRPLSRQEVAEALDELATQMQQHPSGMVVWDSYGGPDGSHAP